MNRISRLLRERPLRNVLLAGLTVAVALPVLNARAAEEAPVRLAAPPPAPKLETDTFLVEITAGGPYKSGAAGSVKVTLTTKGVFHINSQYPYRFKAASPPEGVSYPKPVLERGDAQFEEKKAVFTLPFVASHAGKFTVGGVFSMSVCSAGSCIMQKASLEIPVTVQ